MFSSHAIPAMVRSHGRRCNFKVCSRSPWRDMLKALIAGATLFTVAPVFAVDNTVLDIKVITWDVIGLDSNKPSSDGPVDFPLAVRVKNTGPEPAVNVVVTPELLAGGNPHLSIVGEQQIIHPLLAPNAAADFYFHVQIARPPANNSPGYFSIIGQENTLGKYEITADADNAPLVSTNDPVSNRQLFVEKILSQNRNSVDPTLVVDNPHIPLLAGQTRIFTLNSMTATGYDQQETTVNFPTDVFQIISVKAVYGEPMCGCLPGPATVDEVEPLTTTAGKYTTNKVYADGCGWVTDSEADGYMSSNEFCKDGTENDESPTAKIGGAIETKYLVKVLKTPTDDIALDCLVHDHSGSSFHYDFDENIFVVNLTNVAVEKSALEDPVEAGEEFDYLITVVNTHNETVANDVVLTDSLPSCATFVSADPPPVDANADPLRWELGDLDPGVPVNISVVATASCDIGPCENIASVSTIDMETSYEDNEDNAIINIVDTTDPTIDCPDNVTVECGAGTDPTDTGVATADDLCGIASIVPADSFASSCGLAGIITRTWTATDVNGNTSECVQTITIADTTDPVISGDPEDATAECDDVPAAAVLTATDNCDDTVPVVFTEVRTNGNCPDSYTLLRTWTATDDCGNAASVEQTVTVSDTTDPVLSGDPEDAAVECDDVPAAAVLTATDNCDDAVPVVFTEVRTNGNCPDSYTLLRTWTATDDCGNAASVEQTVTVSDTTDPVLSGDPEDAAAECDDVPAAAVLTATDNCDDTVPVVFTEVRTNGNCPDSYTLLRTWTATDDCGNDTSVEQTVTVSDTTDPVLSGDPEDATAECDDVPAAAVLTATDNCDDAVPVVFTEVRTNGNCPDSYTLLRTWTATDDCGNAASVEQTVTVADTTDPELSDDPADVTIECDDPVPAAAVLTATDNCDDTVPVVFTEVRTNGNCPDSYTLLRTWTATDDCGNDTSVDQIITVADTTPPTITCPENISVPGPTGTETCVAVNFPDATVSDNCDDDVTVTFEPPSGTCFECGTVTVITATATDDCGLTSECTFTVTVGDCLREPGCSLTQGYWKNHPEDWPVESLTLGSHSYTKAQAIAILQIPVNGNGLVALAHQLIAAKLNVANAASDSCIANTILAADQMIGNKLIPPLGTGYVASRITAKLTGILDNYNNGDLCVPHCDDLEPPLSESTMIKIGASRKG